MTAECLIGGSVRATHTLQMAGVQTQLALSREESGRPLVADTSDFIVVQASIRDERGMISPLAENLVQFEVSGEGEIIGDEAIGANPNAGRGGSCFGAHSVYAPRRQDEVRERAFGRSPATLQFESMPLTSGRRSIARPKPAV